MASTKASGSAGEDDAQVGGRVGEDGGVRVREEGGGACRWRCEWGARRRGRHRTRGGSRRARRGRRRGDPLLRRCEATTAAAPAENAVKSEYMLHVRIAADLERGERRRRIATHHGAPGQEDQREQEHVRDRRPRQRPHLAREGLDADAPRRDADQGVSAGTPGSVERGQQRDGTEARRKHDGQANARRGRRLPPIDGVRDFREFVRHGVCRRRAGAAYSVQRAIGPCPRRDGAREAVGFVPRSAIASAHEARKAPRLAGDLPISAP